MAHCNSENELKAEVNHNISAECSKLDPLIVFDTSTLISMKQTLMVFPNWKSECN